MRKATVKRLKIKINKNFLHRQQVVARLRVTVNSCGCKLTVANATGSDSFDDYRQEAMPAICVTGHGTGFGEYYACCNVSFSYDTSAY
jgi:hypothetical protein